MLEHCNLMSMYIYSKSTIYFSECRYDSMKLLSNSYEWTRHHKKIQPAWNTGIISVTINA